MDHVSAPYNFVPLGKVVSAEKICPDLEGLPSQDHPQIVTDGQPESGEISFDIVCPSNTPILVGAADEEIDQRGNNVRVFMQTPGDSGKPVIPGSSIRGMVRNVLEIASFGSMRLVENQRASMRDLQPTAALDYRDKFVAKDENGYWRPASQAGFLNIRNGELVIEPRQFARIQYEELNNLVTGRFLITLGLGTGNTNSQLQQERTNAKFVESKFTELGGTVDDVELYVDEEEIEDNNVLSRSACVPPKNSMAPIGMILKTGRLVFTGIPSDKKRREFFFYPQEEGSAVPLTVEKDVWSKFIDVHERQESPSSTWEWRRQQLHRGEDVPVFFLQNEAGEITDIGLAMMFKLGADNCVHDMIEYTDPDHLHENTVDLATRIFGRHPGANGENPLGFRTRASFGWAELSNSDQATVSEYSTSSLAKPKISFLPSYIRQRDFGDNEGRMSKVTSHLPRTAGIGKQGERNQNIAFGTTHPAWKLETQYRSYMKWSLNGKPVQDEIRGWKRYPVRDRSISPPPPVSTATTSRLGPIKGDSADLRFKARLRYHNLHPIELGALVWALTLGGKSKLLHSIGTGKKFGWGKVRCQLNDNQKQLEEYRAKFVKAMELSVPGWKTSRQITSLLSMADPVESVQRADILNELKLAIGNTDPSENGNEFLIAKRDGAILPEFLGLAIQPNMEFSERKGSNSSSAIVSTKARDQNIPDQEGSKVTPTKDFEVGMIVSAQIPEIPGKFLPLVTIKATVVESLGNGNFLITGTHDNEERTERVNVEGMTPIPS